MGTNLIKKSCVEKLLLVMDQSTSQKISSFLLKFVICESSYKALSGIVFNNAKEDIRISEVLKVIQQLSIQIPKEMILMLFGPNKTAGERSIKILRNEIVHSLNKNAVSEVIDRYNSLNEIMDVFIQAVINA